MNYKDSTKFPELASLGIKFLKTIEPEQHCTFIFSSPVKKEFFFSPIDLRVVYNLKENCYITKFKNFNKN